MITKHKPFNKNQVFCATLDDLVPKDHLLRKIEDFMDWDFIYDLVGDLYSPNKGRPSIDPVLLFKTLFIQYLYGIQSMRQTIEECRVNNAYKWFLHLQPFENPPHYSTFSQNYKRKFQGKGIFHKIFEHILEVLINEGLIDEEIVFVDSTHVKANANPNKFTSAYIKKSVDQFEETLRDEINKDRKNHGKKELKERKVKKVTNKDLQICFDELIKEAQDKEFSELKDFECELKERSEKDPILKQALYWIKVSMDKENLSHLIIKTPLIVIEGKLTNLFSLDEEIDLNDYDIKKTSTTDPNSGWFHKGKHKHVFAYVIQTCCEKHGYILSYAIDPGNLHDSVTFFELDLSRFDPNIMVLDLGYKTPKVVHSIFEQNITPLLPYKRPMNKKGFFKTHEYVYDEYYDCYICPNNKVLEYTTTNRQGYREFKSDPKICVDCPYISKCTQSQNHVKVINQHVWFAQMQLAEEIRYSLDMQGIYALRKETVERDFGDCKEKHGMRYTNYRGEERVEIQIATTYAMANLKKGVTHLPQN